MVRGVGFTTQVRPQSKDGISGNHYDIGCSDGSYAEWLASFPAAKEGKQSTTMSNKSTLKSLFYMGNDNETKNEELSQREKENRVFSEQKRKKNGNGRSRK